MNVILAKQIIQDCNAENLSNEVILCLIRAGMVLTITEIWRVFVQERDFSGNIAKPMEKAKRSNLAKTKVHKSKKAVIDGGKIKAKKSSKTSIKTITRKSKKSMVLEKSETKNKFPKDDSQSKKVMSTSVNMPQEIDECRLKFTQKSEETFDSQGTISDLEVHSNIFDNQKPESDAVEKGIDFSASFHGETESLNSFYFSESRESFVSSSNSSGSLVSYNNQLHLNKKATLSEDIMISDKFGKTETNLKRSGKHAPRFKSVSGTTIPEIILANQDRKISGKPSSPTFNTESKLAIDNPNSFNNSISNIMTDIRPPVDDLGAGTGSTNRNLRPRYHTDKLSEYFSK